MTSSCRFHCGSQFWLTCACILALALGCSKSGHNYPTGEVSGTVKYKGEPISQGKIMFLSTGQDGYFATGQITDGKYNVPDAPAGKCRIEIQPQSKENVGAIPPQQMRMAKAQLAKMKAEGKQVPDELQKTKRPTVDFPKKYMTAQTSGLEMDVQKGKQTKDWDLQ
jgi:hypothetical protein